MNGAHSTAYDLRSHPVFEPSLGQLLLSEAAHFATVSQTETFTWAFLIAADSAAISHQGPVACNV